MTWKIREHLLPREENRLGLPSRRGGRRIVLWVALCAIGFMEAGCYPKAAPAPGAVSANSVTWAATRWPGVTASALEAGRDLFVSKCNGCHGYPDLAAIAEKRWPDIVESMAKKSHLDAGGRDAVLHYVLASRSEQAGR
jgi:mono/diheme cytochrome c family protein